MELILEAYEASDPNGTPLGELTDATQRFVRVQYNGDGEGRFQINRHSAQAAWFEPDAPSTYIKAYRDSTAGTPIFGFLTAGGGDTIIAAEEEGAEEYTRSGLGGLSYLADAIVYHKDYTGNDAATPKGDGFWHWTDRPVGAILVRQLEEAQARNCILAVTWDFSRTLDSDGNPWSTSAHRFRIPIGMRLRDLVTKCQSAGLIVQMDADLVLHAWDTDPGLDLSGSIIFTPAVNLRDAVERQVQASAAVSNVLVQGDLDSGALKIRSVRDAVVRAIIGRRKEAFVQYNATPTNAVLDRVGRKAIAATKSQYDGPTSLPVLNRAGEVPFDDYNPGDMVGVVLPGMAGAIRVAAISLVEAENGEVDPVLDLGEETFDPFEELAGPVKPGGTGGGGGGGGTPPVVTVCGPTDTFERSDGAVGISDAGLTWQFDFTPDMSVIEDGRFRMIRSGFTQTHHLDFTDPGVPDTGTLQFELTGLDIDELNFTLASVVYVAHTNADTHEILGLPGDSAAFIWEAGVVYNLRCSHDGTTARAKVWKDSDPEPGAWTLESVEVRGDPGFFYFSYQAGGGADEAIMDELIIDGICGTNTPPGTGQPWRENVGTGDGVTTAFTTTYPYIATTLAAFTDNLPEPNIAETSPSTGGFAFDTAPFVSEELTVTYLVA